MSTNKVLLGVLLTAVTLHASLPDKADEFALKMSQVRALLMEGKLLAEQERILKEYSVQAYRGRTLVNTALCEKRTVGCLVATLVPGKQDTFVVKVFKAVREDIGYSLWEGLLKAVREQLPQERVCNHLLATVDKANEKQKSMLEKLGFEKHDLRTQALRAAAQEKGYTYGGQIVMELNLTQLPKLLELPEFP